MVASNHATKWIRHSDFAFSLSNFASDRISFRERQKFEKKQFYAWLISLSLKKKGIHLYITLQKRFRFN